MESYDIFISYRREGGEQTARILYDKLKEKGYRVFLDVETLRSGAFNTQLYNVIDGCKDVLVILSPNALDRCVHENDWVRLELAHAFKAHKNIVPVLLRGFTFPDTLPDDLSELPMQHGIQASMELFDAFIDKLSELLKSKPNLKNMARKWLNPKTTAALITIAVILSIGFVAVGNLLHARDVASGSYAVSTQDTPSKTLSDAEKKEVESAVYYSSMQLSLMNNLFGLMDKLMNEYHTYALTGENYDALLQRTEYTRQSLDALVTQSHSYQLTLDSFKSGLFKGDDLLAMNTLIESLNLYYASTMNSMTYYVNPDFALSQSDKLSAVEINQALLDQDIKAIFNATVGLYQNVDDQYLTDFKTQTLSSLTYLSEYLNLWTKDGDVIKATDDAIYNKQLELIGQLDQLVGNWNVDVSTMESQLQALEDKQIQVDETKASLDDLLEQLKATYKPEVGDDANTLWYKGMNLLAFELYDDAKVAYSQYQAIAVDDENASIYVPAIINYIDHMDVFKEPYGLVITKFEEGDPSTPFEIGDIIISVKGEPIYGFEAYQAVMATIPNGESYEATIIRASEDGPSSQILTLTRGKDIAWFNNLLDEASYKAQKGIE